MDMVILEDITKENWEYIAFLTTNENKMPTLVEKYLNGNAYSMLEVIYRDSLEMKAIVLCENDKKKGIGFVSYGPSEDDNGNTVYMLRRFMIDVRFQGQGYGAKALKLVLEEILNGLVGNHLLIEDVSTSLGALYHLNNLCVSATIL